MPRSNGSGPRSETAQRVEQAGAAHALDIEGVGRTFGAVVALADVSFSVGAGERRAVLGANGAGKTTLFNAITGDFPATSGRIRFFGEDVTDLPPHERIRRGLRRTYQHSLLFRGLTILDNLYLSCRGVTRRRYSLKRPGKDDPALRMAKELAHTVRLDHLADTPVSELAYGQQRQLEIGMALSGAPRFILFDEPAAGLSSVERRELIQILQALPRHIGYIIIEHDLDVALRVVDRVTIMHNGRLFKHGSPEEIETDPEVQRIYLGGGHG
ncbi:ABC transporter ATP-binding protein [Marivibrio halodurans]|uniref:ABC transporter ATP-binding protein n=2 Tax=Marivibrio halodurans TaxID=2039722 RepID=A0A8J7SAA2_9PROT|nr:ABC transporter ATP-binding protein [Marivibrio halodurans]MBP5858352.1 ABC transporter ATP-binding protein [Marivibrio halodurans]